MVNILSRRGDTHLADRVKTCGERKLTVRETKLNKPNKGSGRSQFQMHQSTHRYIHPAPSTTHFYLFIWTTTCRDKRRQQCQILDFFLNKYTVQYKEQCRCECLTSVQFASEGVFSQRKCLICSQYYLIFLHYKM